jgi:uncharacterized protein involved in type VI secretion and phage assembly
MKQSLVDLLTPQDSQQGERIYGVVMAIVTSNQDPDKMGRVRVKFPWLSDDHESWWARIATPMAGPNRGVWFLPEVDDEVLVAFDHGDIRVPYVVGSLWNGKDKPPADNADGQNNLRLIHSRSGHLVRLDDKDGDEKIEIIDKTSNNSITIKSSDNSISILCDGKLTIHAKQGIEMTSDMDISIKANTEINVQANTDISVKANTTIDIEATAPMTLKGAMVNIN